MIVVVTPTRRTRKCQNHRSYIQMNNFTKGVDRLSIRCAGSEGREGGRIFTRMSKPPKVDSIHAEKREMDRGSVMSNWWK